MRLPILLVADVLNENFKEVNWFTNEVPEEFQSLPELPVGRIVELYSDYDAYASSNPNYHTATVQIDVWVNNVSEIENYYFEIDRTMRDAGYHCAFSEETYEPDLEGSRRLVKRYTVSQYIG